MTKNDLINDAFDNGLNDKNRGDVDAAVKEIISSIDKGIIRVAENHNGEWSVNETAKKAKGRKKTNEKYWQSRGPSRCIFVCVESSRLI